MGVIYFNPTTGKFWESTKHRRKPPEGFVPTGKEMDHRYRPHYYIARSYFCPVCGCYHPLILLRVRDMPLWFSKQLEYGEKYGCKVAEKLIEYAVILGEKRQHYEFVEKLYSDGTLEKWMKILKKLPARDRSKVVKMIREGKSESEIMAYVVSVEIKR